MNSNTPAKLWLRWVIANGLGEMFGLGLTFLVGVVVIPSLGNQQSVTVIVITFLVAVASGAIEATIVGLAQWWAMHPWFQEIRRVKWWLATLVSALVAYVFGYLPSTLMSLGEQTSPNQTAAAEPAQWLVFLLAALLGVVGGAVLSFTQWLELRRNVGRAHIWMPANMLAWMAGMPLIFWGINAAQKLGEMWIMIMFMGFVLLMTGMVVGAIHGIFLARLFEAGSS